MQPHVAIYLKFHCEMKPKLGDLFQTNRISPFPISKSLVSMSLLSKSASSEPPSLKATFSLSAGGAWGWGLGGGGCSADGGLLAFFSISGVSHGAGAVSPEVHHSVQLRSSMSHCRQEYLCETKSLSPKFSMQPSRGLKTHPVYVTVLTEVFFSATSATLTWCFNTDPSA